MLYFDFLASDWAIKTINLLEISLSIIIKVISKPKSFFCLFGEAPSRKILTFWPKFRHILGKKSLIKNNFTPSCRMSEFLSKCVWKISVGVCIFVECVWKLSEFKFVLKVKIFSYRIDSTWSKCVWIFSKCVWTSCVSARHCLERDNIFRQTFCKSVQYITSKCVDFKNYIFWMGKRREKSDTFLVKKSASRHFEKKSFWGHLFLVKLSHPE